MSSLSILYINDDLARSRTKPAIWSLTRGGSIVFKIKGMASFSGYSFSESEERVRAFQNFEILIYTVPYRLMTLVFFLGSLSDITD